MTKKRQKLSKLRQRQAAKQLYVIIAAMVIMTVVGTAITARAATTPAPTRNIPYGIAPREMLDVWPSATPNSPLVVLVHDGGWWTGDKKEFDAGAALFLQSQGFTIVNANYRLDSSIYRANPMEVDDIKLATEWAIAHAAQYNADPNRVTLVGASAGGHLVAMASQQLNTASVKKVKSVVTLSALTDIVSLAKDQKAGTLDPRLNKDVLLAIGCNLSACSTAQMTQWSPAKNVTAANCPNNWLMFNSSAELAPMDQPNNMATALSAHGCKSTKTILIGTKHSVEYWGSVKTAIANFIKAN